MFSWSDSAPQERTVAVWRHFGLSQLGVRVLLASGGSRWGVLLNVLQDTGQLLHKKEFSGPKCQQWRSWETLIRGKWTGNSAVGAGRVKMKCFKLGRNRGKRRQENIGTRVKAFGPWSWGLCTLREVAYPLSISFYTSVKWRGKDWTKWMGFLALRFLSE